MYLCCEQLGMGEVEAGLYLSESTELKSKHNWNSRQLGEKQSATVSRSFDRRRILKNLTSVSSQGRSSKDWTFNLSVMTVTIADVMPHEDHDLSFFVVNDRI